MTDSIQATSPYLNRPCRELRDVYPDMVTSIHQQEDEHMTNEEFRKAVKQCKAAVIALRVNNDCLIYVKAYKNDLLTEISDYDDIDAFIDADVLIIG